MWVEMAAMFLVTISTTMWHAMLMKDRAARVMTAMPSTDQEMQALMVLKEGDALVVLMAEVVWEEMVMVVVVAVSVVMEVEEAVVVVVVAVVVLVVDAVAEEVDVAVEEDVVEEGDVAVGEDVVVNYVVSSRTVVVVAKYYIL